MQIGMKKKYDWLSNKTRNRDGGNFVLILQYHQSTVSILWGYSDLVWTGVCHPYTFLLKLILIEKVAFYFFSSLKYKPKPGFFVFCFLFLFLIFTIFGCSHGEHPKKWTYIEGSFCKNGTHVYFRDAFWKATH